MVEVALTVGKLDASLALLLTKDHHLIEFPTILLPNGVRAGSIIKIKCDQDLDGEKEEEKQFHEIQDEILTTFGKNLPSAPKLSVKNVTQTSCVLEWEALELGTATLKNLILFKDGKKLGSIPLPLTSKTTKLSGLPIDKTFRFQLRLDTTAGVFSSEVLEVSTHKMTDLSGITVCLGDISSNEQFTVEDIEHTLKSMGAQYPPQQNVKVDTTHFICTRENKQNPEFLKASDMNIPIIRPEWLKACERERRIVGVRDFYVRDCVLPDLFAKNYWQSAQTRTVLNSQPVEASVTTDAQGEISKEVNQDDDHKNDAGKASKDTGKDEPMLKSESESEPNANSNNSKAETAKLEVNVEGPSTEDFKQKETALECVEADGAEKDTEQGATANENITEVKSDKLPETLDESPAETPAESTEEIPAEVIEKTPAETTEEHVPTQEAPSTPETSKNSPVVDKQDSEDPKTTSEVSDNEQSPQEKSAGDEIAGEDDDATPGPEPAGGSPKKKKKNNKKNKKKK